MDRLSQREKPALVHGLYQETPQPLVLEDFFPINLLSNMTIKTPPTKKITGAKIDVYLSNSGITDDDLLYRNHSTDSKLKE